VRDLEMSDLRSILRTIESNAEDIKIYMQLWLKLCNFHIGLLMGKKNG
jgi:hypothetical protein